MTKALPPADIPLSRVARRKERTKRHLLEVARRLFSEKGIYWAKVEDITELADLGEGTFYKYFDSKKTIIQVLLKEGLGELLSKRIKRYGMPLPIPGSCRPRSAPARLLYQHA